MDKNVKLEELEEIDKQIMRLIEKRYSLVRAFNRAFPTDQINQRTTFLATALISKWKNK